MNERFIDNQDGTITDTLTGLMRQEGYACRETGNYISWYDANEYIVNRDRTVMGVCIAVA